MEKEEPHPEVCKGCYFAIPNNINFTCKLKPILNNEQ